MTAVHLNVAHALPLCSLSATEGKKICFSSNSKAVSAVKETLKQLGQRLAAPSALGGVNGLCHLYKQVSGGHRAGLGDVNSQGSSVTRERVCFIHYFFTEFSFTEYFLFLLWYDLVQFWVNNFFSISDCTGKIKFCLGSFLSK